jgi:hypothetical protein
MAPGSHAGWFGMPKEKRVCASCGEKLTLAHSGSLWFETNYETGGEHLVYHFQCRLRDEKRPAPPIKERRAG